MIYFMFYDDKKMQKKVVFSIIWSNAKQTFNLNYYIHSITNKYYLAKLSQTPKTYWPYDS